jgi:hypothetical protein
MENTTMEDEGTVDVREMPKLEPVLPAPLAIFRALWEVRSYPPTNRCYGRPHRIEYIPRSPSRQTFMQWVEMVQVKERAKQVFLQLMEMVRAKERAKERTKVEAAPAA